MKTRLKLTICVALWSSLIVLPICAFFNWHEQTRPAVLTLPSVPQQKLTGLKFLDDDADGFSVPPSAADVDNPNADVRPRNPEQSIQPTAPRLLTDAEFLGSSGNGLPAGAWASTLVADTNYPNHWRDPATRTLYTLVNGKIIEETNYYFYFPPEALKRMAVAQAQDTVEADKERYQDAVLNKLQQANSIAERKLLQNQQQFDEVRLDNALKSITPVAAIASAPQVLKYNSLLNRWELVPQ